MAEAKAMTMVVVGASQKVLSKTLRALSTSGDAQGQWRRRNNKKLVTSCVGLHCLSVCDVSEIPQYASEDAELLLVGNKLDCEADREISRQQGEKVRGGGVLPSTRCSTVCRSGLAHVLSEQSAMVTARAHPWNRSHQYILYCM